jgi:replicative DNA helicase
MTHANNAILVLAPYEAQVANIFQMLRRLMENSKTLTNSLSRSTLNPHRLQFNNGSYILGFSAGSKTAARSDKIRGQDAHVIYIDEFDYIPDSDISAISAIMLSHPDCKLWTTSTPTGEHKRFFAICTDKDLGYKEFWVTSMEVPHWDDKMELETRREYNATVESSPEWEHEILADFGEQIAGVFRNSMIDASLQDYKLGDFGPREGGVYILGVDWNKTAGTHMVIVEWNGVFKILDKIVIPRSEFTQTIAVEKIIEMHQLWNFKGVYVDRGYGSTQVEMLKKWGLQHPDSNLYLRLKDFAMQEMTDVRDPGTGAIVKKHTKPFLVSALAQQLDEDRLILPKSEDTRVIRDDQDMGIVQQMRNFKIEGYSVHGLPKYSQGPEHTLTALMLAVGGYVLENTDLTRLSLTTGVGIGPGFGQDDEEFSNEQYTASGILKDLKVSSARKLDIDNSGYSNNAGSVRQQLKAKQQLIQSLRRNKRMGEGYTRNNIQNTTRKNV